jgi:alpha-mannosidase
MTSSCGSSNLTVQDWGGYIGQWDNRVMQSGQYQGVVPGYIKRAPVAWFASHRHTADGANEAYAYSYLFAYELDLPANAKTLRLPDNEKIRILAVTVSDEGARADPAQPLYDTLER